MDFDDIMAKYLDGSITESETNKLNTMIAESPALKEEFIQLSALEKQLESSRTVLNQSDIAFLSIYGDNLFKSSSGTTGTGALVTKSTFFTTKMNIILASASLIIGAGLIAYFMMCGTGNKNTISSNTQNNQQPTATKIESGISDRTIERSKPIQVAPLTKQTNEKIEEYDNTSSVQKMESDVRAQINQTTTLKNKDLIARIQSDLKNYEAQNDVQNQVLSLKKLAILYRDGENMPKESRMALDNAMELANISKNPELVAEIFGEIGLLDKKIGNNDQAVANIEKCLELLKDSNSARAKHWQKQLEKIKL